MYFQIFVQYENFLSYLKYNQTEAHFKAWCSIQTSRKNVQKLHQNFPVCIQKEYEIVNREYGNMIAK